MTPFLTPFSFSLFNLTYWGTALYRHLRNEFGKFMSYFACCLAAPFNFGAVRAYE